MTDMAKVERITVRIVRPGTSQSGQGAVVLLRVKVPKKNSYAVGPKIADSAGVVLFTRDEIENEISLCKATSPMDYQSDLDDAIAFEVEVMDAGAIDSLISARRMWGSSVPEWRLSSDEEKRLQASRAQKWESARDVLLVKELNEVPQSLQFDLCSAPSE